MKNREWARGYHEDDAMGGYLLVGQKLLEGKSEFSKGWNFGPADEASLFVGDVVAQIKKNWDKIEVCVAENQEAPHEANLLKLDCTRARERRGWHPAWNAEETFKKTVDWYRAFYENKEINTELDLQSYQNEWNPKESTQRMQAFGQTGFVREVLASKDEDVWNEL